MKANRIRHIVPNIGQFNGQGRTDSDTFLGCVVIGLDTFDLQRDVSSIQFD